MDENVLEQLEGKMDEIIEWVKKEFPEMTEEKFHKDVKEFVRSFPKVAAKLETGKVCKIVENFAIAQLN